MLPDKAFRGETFAGEIAETLDNLFAYAALTDVVESRQFDLYFDATLGDDAVRAFLIAANPLAARGMASPRTGQSSSWASEDERSR